MTTHPLYRHGRASALPHAVEQHSPETDTDYDLVARLRTIRADGDEAMTAVEEYDPNFSLKLASCTEPDAAEALLTEWLQHRVHVLEQTRDSLREAWARGVAARAQS